METLQILVDYVLSLNSNLTVIQAASYVTYNTQEVLDNLPIDILVKVNDIETQNETKRLREIEKKASGEKNSQSIF